MPQPSLVAVPYRQMHRRLMHAGKAVVEEACRHAGIELTDKKDDFCEGCVKGKMRDELGKAPLIGNDTLDVIRVDLVTHKDPGHLGYRYSFHIIDAWSNYQWVKFLCKKDRALKALVEWVTMIETQTGRKIKVLGLDGGAEVGQATRPFLDDQFKV